MKIVGQFEADFGIALIRVHIGEKDGRDKVQISFPQIGDMNNDTSDVVITESNAECIYNLDGFPLRIQVEREDDVWSGTVKLDSIGFNKKLQLQKISDESGFVEHNYIIPEENLSLLRAHAIYENTECETTMTYELNNQEVLSYIKMQGIEAENHHDFSTVYALMKKTTEMIHHDGANYQHDASNYGTIAQMEHAAKNNNYTNCRGISIILSGILRAYGFMANVVECWPLNKEDIEIHVMCEVYVTELCKWVLLDPSNNLIYYKNDEPMSLLELREALVTGESDSINRNEDSSHNGTEISTISMLGYISKNLMFFRKAIHSNESSEIVKENSICLAPKDLVDQGCPKSAKNTCNIMEYYPVAI